MTQKLAYALPDTFKLHGIHIQNGLLNHPLDLINELSTVSSHFAIITDSHLTALYGQALEQMLNTFGLKATVISFPAGESFKTRQTKENLEDQLFEAKIDRTTCLIGLGGGVVTDIAGYIASTYGRGLPYIAIPTSLLGMVDASIGGKNGVNTPYGKNTVGTIYQPVKVLIDPATLQTLPSEELRNGVVEMIKHALIADCHHFTYLQIHVEDILNLNPQVVEQAICDSCHIKQEIVQADERESGKRHLLNFGHTVGHALEHVSHYKLSHGEAVAIGMLVESHISVQLGYLDAGIFKQIQMLLQDYGLPFKLPRPFSFTELYQAMLADKKSTEGQPRFVMINQIGSSLEFDGAYCTHVDSRLIEHAIDWMNDDLCRH